jgi:hypothetical protein
MNAPIASPEQKRPVLHRLIDALPAEDLELAERFFARLEMQRLWKQVREGFTEIGTLGNTPVSMKSSMKCALN